MRVIHKYTEYTTKSGNTSFIVIEWNKRKPFLQQITYTWYSFPEYKRHLIIQKLLGLGLFTVGSILLLILREGAGFLFCGMGLLRMIFND